MDLLWFSSKIEFTICQSKFYEKQQMINSIEKLNAFDKIFFAKEHDAHAKAITVKLQISFWPV